MHISLFFVLRFSMIIFYRQSLKQFRHHVLPALRKPPTTQSIITDIRDRNANIYFVIGFFWFGWM